MNWSPKHIALIDNFDSFTYNLHNLIKEVCPSSLIKVFRSDQNIESVKLFRPDCIIISPGPSRPNTENLSYQTLKYYVPLSVPIFGVCLGMQYINEYFKGQTVTSSPPVHGKTALITHSGTYLFEQVSSPLQVARYHSLKINCASSLKVIAEFEGIPMALQHPDKPIAAVQFHPESFLTLEGHQILKNFFTQAGH